MSSQMRLKLLIDKKRQKIIYGEADKNFIDFLFTILSIPVGAAIKLLSSSGKPAFGLGNLYRSIESLDKDYFQPDQNKENFLKPKLSIPHSKIRHHFRVMTNFVYGDGYVKGMVLYMVMDDLSVKPMSSSSMSTISMLRQFKVEDVGQIEEKDIYVSMSEGEKLLRASLHSTTVLSDVFLNKDRPVKRLLSTV